jgi:hypothetical protein
VRSVAKKGFWLVALALAAMALNACASGMRTGSPSAREGSGDATPVIPCDQVAGTDRSGTQAGNRVVLGIVSVPPALLGQVVPTTSRSWPFSRKAGLEIHPTHKTVTVSVPKPWRSRVAIVWGNARPPVSALKFQPCPNLAHEFGYARGVRWNAYAGGFSLRRRRECVPLRFEVGRRSKIVRFGFDLRCPDG